MDGRSALAGCVGMGWIRLLKTGPIGSSCDYGTVSSGSIRRGEITDKLSYYQILMKDAASWSLFSLVKVWNGLKLLRTGSNDGLLGTR